MARPAATGTGVPGPPVVYLPVSLDADGEVQDVRMIRLEDGRVALLGYTALDRFIDCCGEEQAWALVDSRALASIHDTKPYDVKLLDVAVPHDFREQLRTGRPS